MNRKLIDALEISIQSMEAGVPFSECIKRYPELGPELQELLTTAEYIDYLKVDDIEPEQMNRSRTTILSRAKSLHSNKKQGTQNSTQSGLIRPIGQIEQLLRTLNPLATRLVVALAIAVLLILFSGGFLGTSAKSLPGDTLYPVKRVVEDIQVHLATNVELRQEFEDNHSQQRVDEVMQLLELARIQQISFEGIVNSKNDTQWLVSGIPVNIQPDSIIVSGPAGLQALELGTRVEVEGTTTAQGLVNANEIHLREYQLIGDVEAIDADSWQISGINILISNTTPIDPGIRVGDRVTVLIHSEDNGIYALAILHEEHPLTTPMLTQSAISTTVPYEVSTGENIEEEHINGTLDSIGVNYWVVSGQMIYVVEETHISEGIEIGSSISVDYQIEPNGSLTAIEILIIENPENNSERDMEETPDAEGSKDIPESSIAISTEIDETEMTRETPEVGETPESTDSEEDSD